MGVGVCALMITTHPHQGRWIVAGIVFRSGSGFEAMQILDAGGEHRATDGDTDSVQEIAPRDLAIHAKAGIARIVSHSFLLMYRSTGQQFLNRAIGLIESLIGVGGGSGIRVGDGDATKALSCDVAGSFSNRPVRVPQRVVLVGVTVGPAIHGYAFDIARGIESAWSQNSAQLITNISLEHFKRCSQQFVVSRALLVS